MSLLAALGMGRLALSLAAGQPYDGDHDGFTTGPDGKDDVPYTAAAKAKAGGNPKLGKPNETGKQFAARVRAKAKELGATDAKADELAGKAAAAHKAAGQQRKRGGETDDAFRERVKAKAKSLGASDAHAEELASRRVPTAAGKAPAKPSRDPNVKPRDPSELSDAELSTATETHVKAATDAIGKGDVAGHASHADRVERLQAEQEKRAAAKAPKPTEKPKAETTAPKTSTPATKPQPVHPKTPEPAPPAATKTPASTVPEWEDASDPAALEKQAATLFNAETVRGLTKRVPLSDPFADVGNTLSPAEHAAVANGVCRDADRMFRQYPKLAAARDAHPLGVVGIAPTENVVIGDDVCGGFYGTIGRRDGSDATALVSASRSGDVHGPLTLGGNTVTADAAGSFRHEYGHHMESAFPAERKAFDGIFGQGRGTWDDAVSSYGASAPNELWAESFAAFTHKDYGKGDHAKLPPVLHDFWTRTLGT